MNKNELVLQLCIERVLIHALRYDHMRSLGVPKLILSSELKMLLQFLCKIVDSTDGLDHKDIIDPKKVEEYSSVMDEYFENANEEDLQLNRNRVYENFKHRIEEFHQYLTLGQEAEETNENLIDFHHKKMEKEIWEEIKKEFDF
ncbi:hypothetical protein ACFCW7_00190 [Paenibacillus glucanolyticus]|uniref:hypothetical protein n=1 Tax=Paenibacillus glucanolyticus TaxID=59843 RepID=UPI0035E12D7D